MRPILRLVVVVGFISSVFAQPGRISLHVRGTVTDSNTRQAIANATVSVDGVTARTTVNGTYEIEVQSRSRKDVKVQAEGYRPESETYYSIFPDTGDTVTVNMRMFRPGTIVGRLVDAETKRPIPEVTLTPRRIVYSLGRAVDMPVAPSLEPRLIMDTPNGAGVFMTSHTVAPQPSRWRTDADGRFRLEDLNPGSYALLVPPEFPEQIVSSNPGLPPAAEKGYRRQRWPVQESGVEVRPGSVLDVGEIQIMREP